ncbi:MAG: DUF4254 domain-containing protein [Cytophagales bacterium]|nr:DUF4254 domain-containing protein [Cytophagales bacterium]
MFLSSSKAIEVYQQSIRDWHKNSAEHPNPFPEKSLENLFYRKNQIDTIQWHEEDEIRRPDLPDHQLVIIKRNIDKLNQIRTDLVETIDDYIFQLYKDVPRLPDCKMNSETPAWLTDRMSILELKIFHMDEQTQRLDVSEQHILTCQNKLRVLLEQRADMSQCLDELLEDIMTGKRFFKVYRQMKMYNDATLNPSLYQHPSA